MKHKSIQSTVLATPQPPFNNWMDQICGSVKLEQELRRFVREINSSYLGTLQLALENEAFNPLGEEEIARVVDSEMENIKTNGSPRALPETTPERKDGGSFLLQ